MQFNKKLGLRAGFVTALLCGIGAVGAIAGDGEEPPVGIPAPLLIKAINAAHEAKPGYIAEVEIEREDGQIQVDVEILTTEGEKYEVTVEAETSKVLLVEKDDDEGEEENGLDEGGKDAFGKGRDGDN